MRSLLDMWRAYRRDVDQALAQARTELHATGYPHRLGELTDPRDSANPAEWGGADSGQDATP